MPLSRKKQKRERAELERQQEQQAQVVEHKKSEARSLAGIQAKTENQAKYIETINANDIVFCTGPAGTGKTFLAIYVAAQKLMMGEVDRIILCRPAVEAGERFGFLPGDLKEKIDPYLQPVYDSLYRLLGPAKTEKFIKEKIIEIAPLAFMRGRTFDHAFVVLDEAQNATRMQMKMFLTRMGEGAKMVVNGDMTQADIKHQDSGLLHAIKLMGNIKGITHMQMTRLDIVRHPLVQQIIDMYEQDERITH